MPSPKITPPTFISEVTSSAAVDSGPLNGISLIVTSGYRSPEDRTVLVYLRKWSQDPVLLAKNVVLVLVTESIPLDLSPEPFFVPLFLFGLFTLLSDLAVEYVFESAFLFFLAKIAGLRAAVFLFVLRLRLSSGMADVGKAIKGKRP